MRCSIPGTGTHLPGERQLADERGPGGRRNPRRGRGERDRHREVAGRIVDPDAAGNGSEQLGAPDRNPAASLEHRRHLLEPPEVQARHLPATAALGTPDQRLDLDGQRSPAGERQAYRRARRALAAGAAGRRDRSGWSPAEPIWNQAVSPSAPKRFFRAVRIRSPERGSPSKLRTTSTACSRARGPARSPSFVT